MLQRGKSAEWISDRRTEHRLYCRIKDIKWSCDDPSDYNFLSPIFYDPENENPQDDATGDTVASYLFGQYGVQLLYPNMPLIKTGRVRCRNGWVEEWFPIEFFTIDAASVTGVDSLRGALRGINPQNDIRL